ncbi:hypothetical protein Tco_1166944 [Tanacetum coccineum]
MMALTGVEQDDWSIEFDAEHMHFGQDGLDDFDWSNKADDAPVSLALMATNSEGQSRRRSQDYAIIDSGCSGCKTRDKDKLSDFKEFKGVVAFGNDSKGHKKVQDSSYVKLSEDQENQKGKVPDLDVDLDLLTPSWKLLLSGKKTILMHQESLAKAHNDDQRIAFEEEKRKISIAKGKEHIDSTFTLSTANTPP